MAKISTSVIDEKWFKQLCEERRTNYLNAAEIGLSNSVELLDFGEISHFIYELIQNADDAGATNVRIFLFKDKLCFVHDGTRHFNLTDPELDPKAKIVDDEIQIEYGEEIGDINSITLFGFSSKKAAKNKIGKFGIGFKSVYKITKTPMIFDFESRIAFKIINCFIPKEIDIEENFGIPTSVDDTMIVIPFNKEGRNKIEDYDLIKEKLLSLDKTTLFLPHIQSIEITIGNERSVYQKNESIICNEDKDCLISIVTLSNTLFGKDEDNADAYIIRERTNDNLYCAVAFFVDEDNKLKECVEPAYCYFPVVNEKTNLNFVIHAPFRLDSTRKVFDSDPESKRHNDELMIRLGKLSTDGLLILSGERETTIDKKYLIKIDEKIFDYIPYKETDFIKPYQWYSNKFRPFYDEFKQMFLQHKIIPTNNGLSVHDHSYYPESKELTIVFDNDKLRRITGDASACWIITSKINEDQKKYIISIAKEYITSDSLLSLGCGSKITEDFLSWEMTNEFEWLNKFYEWMSIDLRYNINPRGHFYLNSDDKFVSAFDDHESPIMFLPSGVDIPLETINEKLIDTDKKKKNFEKIGIKTPNVCDIIINKIVPKYSLNTKEKIDISEFDKDLKAFFNVFNDSKSDFDNLKIYLSEMRQIWHLCAYNGAKFELETKIKECKMPLKYLKDYYGPLCFFIDIDSYVEIFHCDRKQIMDFFTTIGAKEKVEIIQYKNEGKDISPPRYITERSIKFKSSKRNHEWVYYSIDNCKNAINYIVDNKNDPRIEEISIAIWDVLCQIFEKDHNFNGNTKHTYFYYSPTPEFFEMEDRLSLKEKTWMMNDRGDFVITTSLYRDEISDKYRKTEQFEKILEFLGIDKRTKKSIDSNLTAEESEYIEMCNLAKKYGVPTEKVRAFILQSALTDSVPKPETRPSPQCRSPVEHVPVVASNDNNPDEPDNSGKTNETENNEDAYDSPSTNQPPHRSAPTYHTKHRESEPIDFEKIKTEKRKKFEEESQQIETEEKLYELVNSSEKYSYVWFKALLQLEMINEGSDGGKAVSIEFNKVEKITGTEHTFVLKMPSKEIPDYIEELYNIKMEFTHLDNHISKGTIEAASIRSNELIIRIPNDETINCSDVTLISINVSSPDFLIKQLIARYDELKKDDNYNFKDELTDRIKFVFGPPGTGKTTYLCKCINEWLCKNNNKTMLILTPTNKASDVITNRLIDVVKDEKLLSRIKRFGNTIDENIISNGLFEDRTFDHSHTSVVITTTARFYYDIIKINKVAHPLYEYEWDSIVFDEASMIKLPEIMLPLQNNKAHFVIAGDPFQLEPVTSVDLWAKENIYKMVELNSFDCESTKQGHKIILLTMQYRSTPIVGNIFSKYMYGGKLTNYRTNKDAKQLLSNGKLELFSLNIINYPVSTYESIYKVKRLGKSPYQVYSAIFTVELLDELIKLIPISKETFSIGIISPYAAQTKIINKIISKKKLPEYISVISSTVHSFQGDECDMVILMLNTPPKVNDTDRIYVNKCNLLNVAISRARDYLIIIAPEEKISDQMPEFNKIKMYIEQSGVENYSLMFAKDIENKLFGSTTYVEDNTFTTSHQLVNVYDVPEKKYEVRCDEFSLDVQVRFDPSD